MSFDWEGYFDLADWLFRNPATAASEEASLRSVVSRAVLRRLLLGAQFCP